MYAAFKKFLWNLLNNPLTKAGKFMNGIVITLLVLNLISIPLYFIQTSLPEQALYALEITTLVVFGFEYLFRIWSLSNKKTKYILSWWGVIDFIALIPFLLLFFISLEEYISMGLRLILLLKLIKTYEHIRVMEALKSTTQHGQFNVMEGEKIERVVQKHPFVFLMALVLPLLFLSVALVLFSSFPENYFAMGGSALFFLLSLVFFLKAWLDFHYDVIYITNKRIIIQQREIFGVEMDYLPYEFITNVKPSSLDIFTYLIGAGHIAIETAAEKGNKEFKHSKNHQSVVNHISQNRAKILGEKPNNTSPLIGNN